MKKLFLVIVVAGAMAACNQAGNSVENKKDSIDSMASERKEAIDSSAEHKKDVVDSMAERKKDVINRMDSLNKKDTLKK